MIIALIILLVLLVTGISIYNRLIGKKNQVDNAFSAIDTMLKKRFDLIPNLVETVKQYAQHESQLLSDVVALRSQASNTELSTNEKLELDKTLTPKISGLMLTVENYPDLKASANFINLQHTWTDSEEQISAARRAYNAAVTDYNDAIMMFPGNLFAGMLNYRPMPVLEIMAQERENISAKALFNS